MLAYPKMLGFEGAVSAAARPTIVPVPPGDTGPSRAAAGPALLARVLESRWGPSDWSGELGAALRQAAQHAGPFAAGLLRAAFAALAWRWSSAPADPEEPPDDTDTDTDDTEDEPPAEGDEQPDEGEGSDE